VIRYVFRPLPVWPHEVTQSRQYAQFKRAGTRERIPFPETMELLEREVRALRGEEIVIGIGLRENDIRLDGQPRANARAELHPGVEVSFDSRYGRLSYATDVFTTWQDNLRAIALGLEALRKVDRYGVSKRGQQYAGFAQLTAGGPDAGRGRRLIDHEFGGSVAAALRATHPDTRNEGGFTDRDFADVQAARALTAGSR
jgi:hypothetical protein